MEKNYSKIRKEHPSDQKLKYICDIYIIKLEDSKRDECRSYINRLFNNYCKEILEYENANWNNLTIVEREYFAYEYIRDKILGRYATDIHPDSPEEKEIESFVHNRHFPKKEDLIEEIYLRKNLKNICDSENKSRYKAYKAYNQYVKDIHAYASDAPIVPFNKWKNGKLRVYDTIMDIETEKNCQLETESANYYLMDNLENETIAKTVLCALENESENSESKIKSWKNELVYDVLLKTILSLLEKEFKIKIDINSIRDTLNYLDTHDFDPYDELILSSNHDLYIDENSITELSEDEKLEFIKTEKEKIISQNLEYVYYLKKLEHLDFYTKEDFDDDDDDES